jgi:hypothetical protein
LVSHWYLGAKIRSLAEASEDDEVPRSIRLPRRIWRALDEDARRCKRSSVRQLEALLSKWYDIDDVDINFKEHSLDADE